MHSIYWVISRDCNQRCPHCYNDSEPGAPGIGLDEISACVRNMPDPGRVPVEVIFVSGGEPLLWPELLFPALAELSAKYHPQTEIMVQTNGDFLDEGMLARLLEHKIDRISVASLDRYHRAENRRHVGRLTRLMESFGMTDLGDAWPAPRPPAGRTPVFNFWGAREDTWIGKLWPRGRARQLGLSKAGPDDRFCAMWSGGKGFLDYHTSASEVSVQLTDVYPCCVMTCRPIGDLSREPLIDMLDRCAQHPVFQAINQGRPEAMGESLGIPESYGQERTRALGHHCLWCDEFFTTHAPDLLMPGGRTERGTVDLTIRGRRPSRPSSAAGAGAGASAGTARTDRPAGR